VSSCLRVLAVTYGNRQQDGEQHDWSWVRRSLSLGLGKSCNDRSNTQDEVWNEDHMGLKWARNGSRRCIAALALLRRIWSKI
jgi:hypothetical protein